MAAFVLLRSCRVYATIPPSSTAAQPQLLFVRLLDLLQTDRYSWPPPGVALPPASIFLSLEVGGEVTFGDACQAIRITHVGLHNASRSPPHRLSLLSPPGPLRHLEGTVRSLRGVWGPRLRRSLGSTLTPCRVQIMLAVRAVDPGGSLLGVDGKRTGGDKGRGQKSGWANTFTLVVNMTQCSDS